MTRRGSKEAGLTLVELLVVMVIIATLALIVGRGMAREDNDSVTRDLGHKVLVALRQARNTAVDTGAKVRVVLTETTLTTSRHAELGAVAPETTGPWLELAKAQARGTAVIHAVVNGAQKTAQNPAAGTFPADIVFLPDGSVSNTGGGHTGRTVYVRDGSNTYKQKVVLYGLTGYSMLLTRW